MAEVIDPSAIFGKVKSLRDYNVENTLKNQAMQEGDIKNANAANLYRTQVLTGALASGDPGIFKEALGHLANKGIDVSDISPDMNTAFNQVKEMRQAQYSANPLNAMLGLGLKAEGNLNSATAALGDGSKAGALDPLSASIAGRLAGGGGMPGAMSMPGAPQPRAPLPAAQGDPLQESLDAIAQQQQQTGVSPGQRPELSLPPTAGLKRGAVMPTAANPEPAMQMPQRGALETQAAYEARPDVIKAKAIASKSGEKSGEEIGDVTKALNVSMSNLPATIKRMGDVIKNADNSSYGYGVNNEGDGYAQEFANTGVGQYFEPGRAASNELMGKALAQGVLPEIGNALSQSNLRGNKFLEGLFNDALSIKMNAPNDVKKQLAAKNIEMYVSTLKAMAQHARELGQPAQSDAEIDAAVAQLANQNGIGDIISGGAGKRMPGESADEWKARINAAQGGGQQQAAPAGNAQGGGWSYGGVVK